MNFDQKVEEHEPVDLKRAIEITDQYLARSGEKFESGEEAIAATMFGFTRSKSEFIEICVNGRKRISYKFEFSDPDAPWFQKLRGGTFRFEEELHSRERLIEKVTEFFSYPSKLIVQQCKSKASRSGRSPLGIQPGTPLGKSIFVIVFFAILAAGLAWLIEHCISIGETELPSKSTIHRVIYRTRTPGFYWFVIAIYSAGLTWLIRGCWLEFKIVREMLNERRKKKS